MFWTWTTTWVAYVLTIIIATSLAHSSIMNSKNWKKDDRYCAITKKYNWAYNQYNGNYWGNSRSVYNPWLAFNKNDVHHGITQEECARY